MARLAPFGAFVTVTMDGSTADGTLVGGCWLPGGGGGVAMGLRLGFGVVTLL